jgi:hypothetical protein
MSSFDREEIQRLIESRNYAMIAGIFKGKLSEIESYEKDINELYLDYLVRMSKLNNMIKSLVSLKKSLGINVSPLMIVSKVHSDLPAFSGIYVVLNNDSSSSFPDQLVLSPPMIEGPPRPPGL